MVWQQNHGIAVAVDRVERRRIKKHSRMAGEIMAAKIWQMSSVIHHVLIGRSSRRRRRRFMRKRGGRERERILKLK